MSSGEMIFVVDDDNASALSLEALLVAFGFRVRSFASAEEFLEASAEDGQLDGCLVLDLRLPGMSGLELQKELVSRNLRVPIVMISGHADSQSHHQAIANGAAAFLQKPFSGTHLCDEIRRALATGA